MHAYRLYDCDVPEFPLIVDLYEVERAESGDPADSAPSTRLHLQEVETGLAAAR